MDFPERQTFALQFQDGVRVNTSLYDSIGSARYAALYASVDRNKPVSIVATHGKSLEIVETVQVH